MNAGKQEYFTNLMNGNNFEWENDKTQAGIIVIDTYSGRKLERFDYNYATMIKRQIDYTSKPLYNIDHN